MTYVIKRPSLGPHVRGLRLGFLPKDKLVNLAYANNLDEFLNVLRTTPYVITLEKLTAGNLIEFRKQIINNYIERIKNIYLGVDEESRRIILIHLKFFEYENIRTIASALRAKKSPEDFVEWGPLEFSRRRHIVALALASKDVEELGEKLKSTGHPAGNAFDMAEKYGYDKLSIFIDREWVRDVANSAVRLGDRSVKAFVDDFVGYFDALVTLRSRMWGLSLDELSTFLIGRVDEIIESAIKDQPARFLEKAGSTLWGKLLINLVSGEPTIENITTAMDNLYPAYMRGLANKYVARYTEFSLGALFAHLEYLRSEALALVRMAAMLAEGVELEKRKKILEALLTE